MTIIDTRTPDPKRFIPGATGDWEIVIGMEVHAQVISSSKLFSGASTEFGAEPNANVSLVDAAMPGMLPVINQECVRQAVRTGLGLKAGINKRSIFERKNYFFPDLPQGYQISQYQDADRRRRRRSRFQVGPDKDGNSRSVDIGIERLHLEQDAGKSMHDQHPTMSICRPQPLRRRADGNRVEARSSAPSDEAKAYFNKLRSIVRYLGTCDGNMDAGFDAR